MSLFKILSMKYKTLALNTQRVILSVQDIESNLKDRVVEMIIEREAKGHEKYGQTMDRRDYTKRDWLTHLLEELLDAAQYAMASDEPDLAEQFMYDAMNVLSKIDRLEIV